MNKISKISFTNLSINEKRLMQIERRIERIKEMLIKVGPMRPGSLTQQYKKPKEKKGSYRQISYTRNMRSKSDYVRADFGPPRSSPRSAQTTTIDREALRANQDGLPHRAGPFEERRPNRILVLPLLHRSPDPVFDRTRGPSLNASADELLKMAKVKLKKDDKEKELDFDDFDEKRNGIQLLGALPFTHKRKLNKS